ncbi:MAG: FeS assembly SUF system protein [Myxococcota bacterium]|jgi:FeS assembly SUF system protein
MTNEHDKTAAEATPAEATPAEATPAATTLEQTAISTPIEVPASSPMRAAAPLPPVVDPTPPEIAARDAAALDDSDTPPPAFDPKSAEGIRIQIVDNLKLVFDPEIPVDIYELGLIYQINVSPAREVRIDMTLTSPMCPTAQSLIGQAEQAAREVPFVKDAEVDLVWEPPWDMEKMSEEARLLLGF